MNQVATFENTLESELEQILSSFPEGEAEADVARQYVREPDAAQSVASEQVAGIPGAGLVTLVGPVLLHFIVQIARKALEDAQTRSASAAISAVLNFVKKRFSRPSPIDSTVVGRREEALSAITATLIKAGWSAAAAGKAADLAWASGQRLAASVTASAS